MIKRKDKPEIFIKEVKKTLVHSPNEYDIDDNYVTRYDIIVDEIITRYLALHKTPNVVDSFYLILGESQEGYTCINYVLKKKLKELRKENKIISFADVKPVIDFIRH